MVFDRVGTVWKLAEQTLINGELLGNSLDEALYLHVVLVLPGILRTPVGLEVLLYDLHLLHGSLLGIFLHAGVDGGIDLQTACVKVIAVILAPVFQMVGHCLAEVFCLTVVVALHAVVELNGNLLQTVVFGLCEVAMQQHVVHHHVATLKGVLWIGDGIVEGGGLQHSHEHGCLFGGQSFGGGVEIGLTGRLDTVCVASEVNRVGIHCENFVLVEDHFQLGGDNPLLGLHDEHLQAGNLSENTRGILGADAEHILGQLLRDGAGSTGILVHNGILGSSEETDGVNAFVLIETLVLRVNQSLPESGIHLFKLHRRTVLREELADEFAVGRIKL